MDLDTAIPFVSNFLQTIDREREVMMGLLNRERTKSMSPPYDFPQWMKRRTSNL